MTIFAKYEINAHKIAKDILVFAKVTKFRQIWSHWIVELSSYSVAHTRDVLVNRSARFAQKSVTFAEFLSTLESYSIQVITII